VVNEEIHPTLFFKHKVDKTDRPIRGGVKNDHILTKPQPQPNNSQTYIKPSPKLIWFILRKKDFHTHIPYCP